MYIRKLQKLNEYNSLLEAEMDSDARVEEIKKGFIHRKNQLMKYNNPSIEKMCSLLKDCGLYYVREKCFFDEIGTLFYADFYIPTLMMTIEVDGGYHNDSKRKYLDIKKEYFIAERSIVTLRYSNEDVLKINRLSIPNMIELGKEFWVKVKPHFDKCYLNHHDARIRWKDRVDPGNKRIFALRLKHQFSKQLENIPINAKVEEFDKQGNVIWCFKNIFDAHFQTGITFKNVLKKFEISTDNWKSKFRFITE